MKSSFLVLLLIFSFWSEPVPACSCMGLPQNSDGVAKLHTEADIVIIGRVQEATQRSWVDDLSNRFEFSAEIRVLETFKGANGVSEIELWSHQPTCNASFDLRKTYLFFGYRSEEDGRYYTGRCSSYLYIPIEEVPPGQSWPRDNIENALTLLRKLSETGN